MRLAEHSQHAAYDCEYVALAQDFGGWLAAGDTDLAEAPGPVTKPDTTTKIEGFVADKAK